jgi:putative endonuclease
VNTYYLYIMASKTGTLYVGFTSDIKERVYQHKNHLLPGFTDKYNVERLVYIETFGEAFAGIRREKQIKAWRREKKVRLIDSANPKWDDLSAEWYE